MNNMVMGFYTFFIHFLQLNFRPLANRKMVLNCYIILPTKTQQGGIK